MRILYVGPDYAGSTGRCWRDALVQLGHEVSTFDDERPLLPSPTIQARLLRKWRKRPPFATIEHLNANLAKEVKRFRPELTVYMKAPYILPETLELTSSYGPNFAYMNDDMFNRRCHTYLFFEMIRRMDCILTTKSYNVPEFHAAGASEAIYVANSYDPSIHYPVAPEPEERHLYEGDVAFIGTFWPERADVLSRLAAFQTARKPESGEYHPGKSFQPEWKLNLWGTGWEKIRRLDNARHWKRWQILQSRVRGKELWCEQMGKAIHANKIILGLLCHDNRDLHTTRSFEIPACAGFMLAERTEEHRLYFEEDREAVYFDSWQEMVDKLRFYLGHSAARERIARAGYERCINSGATYVDRARFLMERYGQMRRPVWNGAETSQQVPH